MALLYAPRYRSPAGGLLFGFPHLTQSPRQTTSNAVMPLMQNRLAES